MREIDQGRDIQQDFPVFPLGIERLEPSIGPHPCVIHQQIDCHPQRLRLLVDCLCGVAAAEANRDEFGANAVLF